MASFVLRDVVVMPFVLQVFWTNVSERESSGACFASSPGSRLDAFGRKAYKRNPCLLQFPRVKFPPVLSSSSAPHAE